MPRLSDSDPEFVLYFVHETDKAIRCSEYDPATSRDEYESEQIWIPKSCMEFLERPAVLIPEAEFSARVMQFIAEKTRLV